MAKNTMKAVEEFILSLDKNEVGINDVLYDFWDDTENLEEEQTENTILIKVNCQERQKLRKRSQRAERQKLLTELRTLTKERERLRGILKRRLQRVRVAFNQLFLAGEVKMVPYRRYGIFNSQTEEDEYNSPKTFIEMKEWRIGGCERHIKETKKLVENGEGGYLMRLWLSNLYDYLKSYKRTEVLRRSEMEPWLKKVYKPKGELQCVGSGLAMEVWPERIEENHRQGRQLSLF